MFGRGARSSVDTLTPRVQFRTVYVHYRAERGSCGGAGENQSKRVEPDPKGQGAALYTAATTQAGATHDQLATRVAAQC
jgi:hypothetical protein